MLDVLHPDCAAGAAAVQPGDIHTEFARAPPGRWRDLQTGGRRRPSVWWALTRACGRGDEDGGGSRRRYRVFSLDQREHRPDRHLLAWRYHDLAQDAVHENLDVDRTLVGFNDRDHVAPLHARAGRNVPLDDRALVHVRAERRQPEFTWHH